MSNQTELAQACREVNKRLRTTLALLLVVFGSFVHASAASAQVVFSLGYLNNLTGIPPAETIPFPFDADKTTLLISSGGLSSSHDTGVILIENLTEFPVTIDRGLRVTTDAREMRFLPPLFQIWDEFLPFILAPGQNLVLAETVFPNFDTSDVEFTVHNPPVLSGSVNSARFSFSDRALVLLGRGDATNTPETTPYQQLGVLQPPNFLGGTVLGLGATQAECRNMNTGQVVIGSIISGTLNCVELGLESQPGDQVFLRLRGLARSGGQVPRAIAADKTTVSCMNGKDWIIETSTAKGKCTIKVGALGHDESGSCTDDNGNVNAGVDCNRNGTRGGCNASNPGTGGSCTPAGK